MLTRFKLEHASTDCYRGCACPPECQQKCKVEWFLIGWECPRNSTAYRWLVVDRPHMLRCRNCRWQPVRWLRSDHDILGIPYVINPANGWWEPSRTHEAYTNTEICECVYYDSRGFQLRFDDLFLCMHYDRRLWGRQLRVDCIHGDGVVKYFDPADGSFSDDTGPILYNTDVVGVPGLISSVKKRWRLFRKHSVAARWKRGGSYLARFLKFGWMRRLRCCSREMWRAVAPGKSDAVWARALLLKWLAVTQVFTAEHMKIRAAPYVNTICYLPIGDLVRVVPAPGGVATAGWLWVAFRKPYTVATGHICREGWIHPGILIPKGCPADCECRLSSTHKGGADRK